MDDLVLFCRSVPGTNDYIGCGPTIELHVSVINIQLVIDIIGIELCNGKLIGNNVRYDIKDALFHTSFIM